MRLAMEAGGTLGDGGRERLYGLLVQQIQAYNAILWQLPTAVLAAVGILISQLTDESAALFGVGVFTATLAYAYQRIAARQQDLIEAARRAEATLAEDDRLAPFVPSFRPGGFSAPKLTSIAMWLLAAGVLVLAAEGLF